MGIIPVAPGLGPCTSSTPASAVWLEHALSFTFQLCLLVVFAVHLWGNLHSELGSDNQSSLFEGLKKHIDFEVFSFALVFLFELAYLIIYPLLAAGKTNIRTIFRFICDLHCFVAIDNFSSPLPLPPGSSKWETCWFCVINTLFYLVPVVLMGANAIFWARRFYGTTAPARQKKLSKSTSSSTVMRVETETEMIQRVREFVSYYSFAPPKKSYSGLISSYYFKTISCSRFGSTFIFRLLPTGPRRRIQRLMRAPRTT